MIEVLKIASSIVALPFLIYGGILLLITTKSPNQKRALRLLGTLPVLFGLNLYYPISWMTLEQYFAVVTLFSLMFLIDLTGCSISKGAYLLLLCIGAATYGALGYYYG